MLSLGTSAGTRFIVMRFLGRGMFDDPKALLIGITDAHMIFCIVRRFYNKTTPGVGAGSCLVLFDIFC